MTVYEQIQMEGVPMEAEDAVAPDVGKWVSMKAESAETAELEERVSRRGGGPCRQGDRG